jgi:type I restriction enzyme S subunit
MKDELPQGWCECALENVGEIVTGNTPPRNASANYGDEYPWVKPPDLGSDGPITNTTERLSKKGAALARLVPSGTTLVSCIGLLGKIGFAGRTLATNQQINSVVFDPQLVEPRYGFHYCKTLRPWMEANSSSTTVAIINKGRFSQAPFHLAPLAEQGRIVAKLEKVLGQVETCQQRLAKIPTVLKRFRQAVLAAACSGRLTADWREDDTYEDDLPAGWRWMPLEQLLPRGGIFDGPFGSNLKSSDYTESGVRVIRLENIGQLRFIGEKETFVSREKYKTLERHTVGQGDIIFASFISEEVRACVLPKLSTRAIAKADCFCLRPDAALINNNFLALQLVSQESYDALFEEIHGATRPRINTTQLRKLEVRLCPQSEQLEIVRRVENLFALADRIEARFAEGRKRVNNITQSVLAKAFHGELAPTEFELAKAEGRPFESAEELLKRIGVNGQAKRKSEKNPDH